MRVVLIALILTGCAQPGAVNSRAAGANPYCFMSCHVTLQTIEPNSGDGLTPTIGSVAVDNRTLTRTE